MEYLKCIVYNIEPGKKRKFINKSTCKIITESTALCFLMKMVKEVLTLVFLNVKKFIQYAHCHCTHCQCTQAALKCYAEARLLILRLFYSIIFKRNETKQEIWLPDIRTFGPTCI
ncbi:hypothetical protein HZU67_10511 [Apis mellifera carnica]|uniref:Uncharacterized protein LOC102656085 n=1 Tax=Apis mellifera TaxID=7460 RepID=A0A7M7MVU6_APIME|nr:uncharacterized protein LOC102656085 [Apis mellifera]KAG9427819.1 hypothetical protein HZU67_10511 [Apis mellifera carnica]|eukprot:XP_026301771.1 uncharacterized protein LOC102656085 [Apis mellifera]